MRKKLVPLVLALAMALSLAVPAFAATTPLQAGQNFTELERRIYQALEEAIIEVTAGNRNSTEVTINSEGKEMAWTAQELGLSIVNNDTIRNVLDNTVLKEGMNKVFTCLKLNHPFEMFWVDNYYSWTWRQEHTDSEVWLTTLTCSIDVNEAYRGDSKTTADLDKIARAKSAAKTAESIVAANVGKSDYEKLAAYKDEICALNSYNYDAERELKKDEFAYGDPWQLVYVFDGDPNTKALCEGYAKAFKYLCDLSDFDGNVACYLVEGHEGNDRHMWNVVGIDGAFYLADITYIDTGAAGGDGNLFLAGGSGSGKKYVISTSKKSFTYTYLDNQEDLYTDGYLPLSPTAFTPEMSAKPKPQPAPSFTDVAEGAYYADAVKWAVTHKPLVTNGTSDTTFSPGKDCTEGEILTFLWRAAGEPREGIKTPMANVKESDYFYDAAQWANDLGMIDPGTFEPSKPCTRAQAVYFIWMAFSQPGDGKSAFTDVPEDASYAQAVSWAVEKGITNGDGGDTVFSPDKVCTRGQIVTFLHRAYVPEARLK